MLFNSFEYIFFLPAVAVILYLIPGRYQWLWLLACSVLFYLTLLPEYLILFIALTVLNYFLAIVIEHSVSKRQTTFIFGIVINVIVLAFLKYFGFFEALAIDIKRLSINDHLLKIILPVGLSFFVFTILSYLIEVKRGTVKAERQIGVFASSLLFFPKIMQGPIEKPGNIFPQFRVVKSFNYDMVVEGLKQLLWGYFKKLVVADRIAVYVDAVYGNFEHHSGASLLLATVLYSIQIYADFSGYTDIALGSAKILGFNLTDNFKRPYFATSVKEFWNRWHISFSVWLRDYLFLPLAVIFAGRMKKTKYLGVTVEKWIFMFATMITFSVCGVWHGEGLNFLIWGLIFAVYLTIANWSHGVKKYIRKGLHISKKSIIYRLFNILVTFILISFAWIFFKAESLHDASLIIGKIFTDMSYLFIGQKTVLLYAFIGISILLFKEVRDEFFPTKFLLFENPRIGIRYLSYASIIILILVIGVFDGGQFIYFQF